MGEGSLPVIPMTTQTNEPTTAMPADPDDVPLVSGLRRSTRSKKAPSQYDEECNTSAGNPNETKTPPRANRPKRQAVEADQEDEATEDVTSLQEQIFARMDIDERKEYRGWVELESEPAFFNAILQDLDAKSLTVQEVFALDEASLGHLRKPIYGLIFLYEWTNGDEAHESRQRCPENLWFGNQTTTNACATVALMNIIMNVHTVKLGPELEEFRNSTQSLPPPRRGHALDTNDFIRAIHNSVARRNDLLSEDLLLDNKFAAARKSKRTPAKKRKTSSQDKGSESGTYHYIAFVPVGDQVWELDGLEAMPLCLGSYALDKADGWLSVASDAIQSRMQRQDNDFLTFNLLAVCQSPLFSLSRELARNLATAKALDDAVSAHPSWDVVSPWRDYPDDRLAYFDLTRAQILTDFVPDPAQAVIKPGFDLGAARTLAEELRAEQEALGAQYADESATVDEALKMIRARRRDYTPAVHQWVRILAEKGVLRQLIQDMDTTG